MEKPRPLYLFVAAPTNVRGAASYKTLPEMRSNFYEPVRRGLEEKLSRSVVMKIEVEERKSRVISDSMFSWASDADVYIADITGRNPNVYLELGVRWAVRDSVTVLVGQQNLDPAFNVMGNSHYRFHHSTIARDVEAVVEVITNGLADPKHCDSPVRKSKQYIPVSRADWSALQAEVSRLKSLSGDEAFRLAESADGRLVDEKIRRLEHVLTVNPNHVLALVALGKEYREASRLDESSEKLTRAVSIAPNNPIVLKELGITQGKQLKFDDALKNFRESLRFDAKDTDAWSALGGLLRKMGIGDDPDDDKRDLVAEARECYNRAYEINRHDLYASLNMLRIDLILCKWDPEKVRSVMDEFGRCAHLCRYEVSRKPDDFWRRFDLADSLLFSGQIAEANSAYESAVEHTPDEKKAMIFRIVSNPLTAVAARSPLPSDVLEALHTTISRLATNR